MYGGMMTTLPMTGGMPIDMILVAFATIATIMALWRIRP